MSRDQRFVELKAGQRVSVMQRGRALAGSYESMVRHVGDHGVRIDVPHRGGEALALLPGDELALYLTWHGRVYAVTARVQVLEVSPVRAVLLEPPMAAERIERRAFYRLPVSIRPRLANLLDAEGEVLEALDALVLDLSGGGVQLRTRKPVATGTRLRIAFDLGGDPIDVQLAVIEAGDFGPSTRRPVHRVNARFLNLRRADQERIARWVFLQQLEHRKKGVA